MIDTEFEDVSEEELRVLVAILGARMHYAVPTIMYNNGMLARHFTDFYVHRESRLGFLLNLLERIPIKIINRASTRYEKELPQSEVSTFPLLGVLFSLTLQLAKSNHIRNRILNYYSSRFSEKVARSLWYGANLVYAINAEALELFEAAKWRGVDCVLEQVIVPISIVNKLYQQEIETWSNWQDIIIEDRNDFCGRENREWELAKGILCGSQFVIDSLSECGVEENKCYLVPYAVDIDKFRPALDDPTKSRKNSPLKILYIGNVDLRKGIQYLYQALSLLDSSEFSVKIAGGISLSEKTAKHIQKRVELLGLVTRSDIPDLLSWADVFVLPSICEGSAVAVYEALSAGLPVITTPNSGSVIRDGFDGFIVPIRDPEVIASRLSELYKDHELRNYIGKNARQTAEQHLSWDAYGTRLIRTLVRIANHDTD